MTLSPVQARLASQFAERTNLEKQICFVEGDFTRVPLVSESLDAIYSVEAVVHAPEPEKYFEEASRLLRRGGKLIVVDDYLAERSLSKNETKWLKAYVNGWHVPGATTVQQAQTIAEKYHLKLIKNDDLTPYLRLRSLPNTLAQTLLFLGNHLPIQHAILPSMLGSMASQQCLHMKVIEYRFLVFEKQTADGRRRTVNRRPWSTVRRPWSVHYENHHTPHQRHTRRRSPLHRARVQLA